MANGKYAAYQRLTPNRGNITDDLLNREDQQFKYRAEQREISDRRAAAKTAKEAKADEAHKNVKSFELIDTGSETLNGTYADAITGASEEIHRLTDITLDDTGKYSRADKNKAMVAIGNLNNIPENFDAMAKAIMGEKATYDTQLAAGSVFKNEAYESQFQDGFKGITLSFDNNGMPVGLFKKGQSDNNSDGVINEYDVETMESLNNAYARPEFQAKYNYNAIITKHAEKLEAAINQVVGADGFSTEKTTGIEIDNLNKTVNRALYNEGQPTALMQSFIREKGLDINNQADLDGIEEQYKNDVLIRTKRGKEVDPNSSAKIAAARLVHDKKKSGEVTTAPGDNISLNVDEQGNAVQAREKGGEGYRKGGGYSFIVDHSNEDPKKPRTVQIGEDKMLMQEYLLSDDGEIRYKGVTQVYNNETYQWENGVKSGGGFDKTQLGLAATSEGFEDTEAFRKHLEQVRDKKLKARSEPIQTKLNDVNRQLEGFAQKFANELDEEYVKGTITQGVRMKMGESEEYRKLNKQRINLEKNLNGETTKKEIKGF